MKPQKSKSPEMLFLEMLFSNCYDEQTKDELQRAFSSPETIQFIGRTIEVAEQMVLKSKHRFGFGAHSTRTDQRRNGHEVWLLCTVKVKHNRVGHTRTARLYIGPREQIEDHVTAITKELSITREKDPKAIFAQCQQVTPPNL
jgi:hypothetical protein